jgi:hypothetical protein
MIKDEVEKIIKDSFIYPVQLMEWVLNLVHVKNKKQGMIRVCMDFHDLRKDFLKDNFPTPFIAQIVDECASCEVFYFMNNFSKYNQIHIKPEDQHKMTFIYPWGTFTYNKMPFVLKNVGATFQRAMSFTFHDIKHIVEVYINDLASCSHKRYDHLAHLRLIFERFFYCWICLNPNKCSFCVTLGILLGFIVSTKGIMVDPMKV